MFYISREVYDALPRFYQAELELLVKIGEFEIVDHPAPGGKIASLQETSNQIGSADVFPESARKKPKDALYRDEKDPERSTYHVSGYKCLVKIQDTAISGGVGCD